MEKTIKISDKTKNKLDNLGTKDETYSQIIDRIIEDSIYVEQKNTVFKVKSKVIKTPKKGMLILEIPSADEDETKDFMRELRNRLIEDKKTGKKSILITNKEIKIPRERNIKKKVKKNLMEVTDKIVKERGNKLFHMKEIKKAKEW